MEVPGAAAGFALKLDPVLEGRPETLKVTELAPFAAPRVTSRDPLDPRDTPNEVADNEIEKSAGGGFTVNETVV